MAESTPTLPAELPVLPLRRTVAFPLTLQPLAVNRPVSVETVNRALATDRLVVLLLQDNEDDDPGPEHLRRVGTVGVIRQMAKVGGGINVILEGVARTSALRRSSGAANACASPVPSVFQRGPGRNTSMPTRSRSKGWGTGRLTLRTRLASQ